MAQNLPVNPGSNPLGNTGRQQRLVRAQMTAFQGPLPPPDLLAQYNDIVENGADRLMRMAESQNAHRQELEKKALAANISSETRGQWLGFFIVLCAIAGGVYLIHTGKDAQGLAAIISALTALAGVFVYAKHVQRKELDAKAEAFKKK